MSDLFSKKYDKSAKVFLWQVSTFRTSKYTGETSKNVNKRLHEHRRHFTKYKHVGCSSYQKTSIVEENKKKKKNETDHRRKQFTTTEMSSVP